MNFRISGDSSGNRQQPSSIYRAVTPGYFRTFGIRLSQGRFFNESDRLNAPPVLVVNESFAHRFFGGKNPLMQRIELRPWSITADRTAPKPPVAYQVVGVFHDAMNSDRITEDTQPEMIASLDQMSWPFVGIAARTAVDPMAMTAMLRRTVALSIPGAAIQDLHIARLQIEEQRSTDRFEMALFGCFAGIALLLSAVGIYGVMTFVVQQRTQEVGIRMALGAERGDVVRLMLRSGLRLAITGVVIGIAGAWLLGRAMHSLLYGMQTVDSVSLLAVGVLLLGVAVTACWIPARRAASVDPMRALRTE
jgi:putative ABC transport system permease protein